MTSCMGQGAMTQQPTHCVHALTTIFCSRERNRLRFASLHTMNGLPIVVYVSELVENTPLRRQKAPSQALCMDLLKANVKHGVTIGEWALLFQALL